MTHATIQIDVRSPAASDAATDAVCAHCGLPVPLGLIDGSVTEQFCCEGCRTVFHMLRESGLDGYYRIRRSLEVAPVPAQVTNGRYTAFDDEAFQEMHVRSISGHIREIELHLERIHCGACVWLIEKMPEILPGILETTVRLRQRVAKIRWDARVVALSRIARTLDSLGYPPHPYRSGQADRLDRLEERRLLVHIAVSGAIAGNVMVIAFALYGDMFHGMDAEFRTFFRVASLILTFIALAWPGRTFFRGAIAAIRTRTAHMDLPIALGLGAGGVSGLINTVGGAGDVYFESLTMLVFLLVVGRWLQHRQRRAGREAVEMLYTVTPFSARIVDESGVREAPIESLRAGDLVEVRTGETLPVDGCVMRGESLLDASVITGESKPLRAAAGDAVLAGTVNLTSPLHVRATSVGEATRVGRLMKMVEESAERKSPIVHLAHRVSHVFVLVVIALAMATAGVWMLLDPSRALSNAISLLIVTCPCALGLATPLAMVASVGQAAKRGILIKGGDIVQRLTRPGLIMLDKTGTITHGELAVVLWEGEDWLRHAVSALESHSAHPMALALCAAGNEEAAALRFEDIREAMGRGIEGRFERGLLRVGSRAFMEECGVRVPDEFLEVERGLLARAHSPVFAAVNGEVRAIAGIGDAVRPDAHATIRALERAGWSVGILSGDHADVVGAVAAELELDPGVCRGGVTPEEKLRFVETALHDGSVIMVGDGVNDAPALAAANVGIAVSGGAEASMHAADVYLSRPGLAPILTTLSGANRTLRVIKRNIAVSVAYNAIGASLAIAGVINPLMAAVLMPISSLTVVSLSYRSRMFR